MEASALSGFGLGDRDPGRLDVRGIPAELRRRLEVLVPEFCSCSFGERQTPLSITGRWPCFSRSLSTAETAPRIDLSTLKSISRFCFLRASSFIVSSPLEPL